jgi:hypothetical protein
VSGTHGARSGGVDENIQRLADLASGERKALLRDVEVHRNLVGARHVAVVKVG